MGAHTLALPLSAWPDSGSNCHRGLPLKLSKAMTVPLGVWARTKSITVEPVTTTPSATTGAEELLTSPGTSPSLAEQLHLATVAEAAAGLAVDGIDGPEPAVVGAHIQPVAAGRAGSGAGFLGVTDAAAAKGPVAAAVDLRVEAPALLAAGGVQGNNPVEGGAVHQGFAGSLRQQDGCALGGGIVHRIAVAFHVATAKDPGHLQVFHVGSVNLRGLGVVAAALVAAVVQPARLGRRSEGAAQARQQGQGSDAGLEGIRAYSASGVMRSRVGTPPSDCQVGKCELVVYTAPSSSEISMSRVKKRWRGMG